jgi:tripeptide aminopeptidase
MDRERLIGTFRELVKIPSESPEDHEFITYMEKFFKMEGGRAKKDAYGNLIVKFPAKNSKNTNTIGFACHADTVKPGIGINPIIDGDIIKSDGTTILAADDKAGIAEIIEMIRCATKHPPIEVILCRCEEIGSLGSVNLDYSMLSSKFAYVLDTEEVNKIVVGGPTYITLDVHYTGKPSHAGMAPEKGISSILAASKAISRLKLGKLENDMTANVGTIQGGELRNGVPEHTKIMAECRALEHERGIKLASEMEEIFRQTAKEVGAEVEIKNNVALKAYYLAPETDVVKLAFNALTKYDVKPETQVIKGGTDAAHFNSHGIPTAVLGIGCRDIHSCKEYLIVKEAEIMTNVLIDIVEGLA